MTETFNERLLRVCRERDSHLCVGLDPDFAKIQAAMRHLVLRRLREQPLNFGFLATDGSGSTLGLDVEPEQLADEPDIAKEIACELVARATAESAAAFKPNAGFFELVVAGGAGVPGLVREMETAQVVIYDGKRGDIGNTSNQYARAIFTDGKYDAVTINPLMGFDSVEPFLRDPAHGVFLLCLTSNPGAADFLLRNELYKRIAEKAVEWNRNGNIGLVVGATRVEHAAAVRAIAPELPFLVPGVGAQGGSLAEILDAIDARNNRRFVVNASRTVMFPEGGGGEDHLEVVARAARSLRDGINANLES
jgi:orotidine-5'-phosphate decarboxylase